MDADDTTKKLEGKDTRTRITIIDDDKPGVFYLDEDENLEYEDDGEVIVTVTRNANECCDGAVTVEYTTKDVDDTDHTATAGVDYDG